MISRIGRRGKVAGRVYPIVNDADMKEETSRKRANNEDKKSIANFEHIAATY
jgi:hypothetical protein